MICLLKSLMDGSVGLTERRESRAASSALTSGVRPGVKFFRKPAGMVFFEALLTIFWNILEFFDAEEV